MPTQQVAFRAKIDADVKTEALANNDTMRIDRC